MKPALLGIGALAIIIAGCGVATSSGSAPPPVVVSVTLPPSAGASEGTASTPVVSPTPNPETVRKTAAAAYLASAEAGNKAREALYAKYKTFANLSKARSFYRAYSTIEGAFLAKLKRITVPADTKADMHSLIAKLAAVQALAVEGSGVKSWTEQVTLDGALVKAARAVSAAANLVRSDLGLPPVHL